MASIELPDGSSPDTESLDFEAVEESWNEYELEDGTTLKVKLGLNGVYRLEGQFNDMGEPVYVINSNNQVRALGIPDELMQDTDDVSDVERGVH